MEEAPPGAKLQALVRAYLSPRHRDHAAHGCPLAALATELARQPAPVRDAATEGLEHLLSAIRDACKADGLPLEPEAVLACLVGALALSRVPTDASRSARYLDQTLRMMDTLLQAHRAPPPPAPVPADRSGRAAGPPPPR
jgi:TetR/AcrR family transcriptional repressor of nem operon